MAEVEIDEVLRLCSMIIVVSPEAQEEGKGASVRTVSYEAAEVAAHNAVPGGTLPFIELRERCIS